MENAWGVSPFALNFIKKLEGYTPKPKWDYKQYSLGYGTRWQPGQPVGSKADHEAALAREAGAVNAWLGKNVTAPLTENQRAALISAGFNLGTGEKGLGRLLGDINAGAWDSVAQRLPSFNKAGGQVNKGLVNRRAAEVEMLTGRKPFLADAIQTVGQLPGTTAAAPSGGPAQMPQLPAPPSSRRSRLADMMLAKALSSQPRGWGDALNSLTAGLVGSQLASKYDDAEKGYRSKLAEALMGATDSDALTKTLLSSGDPELQRAGIQAKMQAAQSQAKSNAPLRGKERFMATPNGVMDVETQQIVPGTEPVGSGKPPSGYRTTQEGNLEFIPGGPADPAVKPKGRDKYTEGQSKAANFGNMMVQAEKALLEMTPKGPDGQPVPLENPKSWLGATRDSLVPFEGLRNKMTSDEEQAYKQVARQWIRAKLRKESGAAIGEQEMEQEFQTYFPQYGDGPDVIARKAASRAEATKGMLAESGGAYQNLFPQDAQPVTPVDGQPPAATPPAAPAPAGAPPDRAVEYLRSNPTPEIIAQFEAKYGPGTAQQFLVPPQQPTPQMPSQFGVSP